MGHIKTVAMAAAVRCGAFLFAVLIAFASCDDYETYSEKKEKEAKAIAAFIKEQEITVIDEDQFEEQGDSTSLELNEYVYLEKSGCYLQIVRRGAGDKLEEDKQVNLLCRYYEYNIMDTVIQTRNDYSSRYYDKMSVERDGDEFTASFVSGIMYTTYGASVPSGWLVPLLYINVGRQTTEDVEISRVRIIVPHSQGHSYASASVYPCFYEITYQRER